MMPGSEKEYLIGFDSAKCTQCHGCEIACKAWRELRYGVQYRRVLNLWQGEYPSVKNASLSLACLHCVEPACAAACPEDAISKRGRDGLVTVDETICNGCGTCAVTGNWPQPLHLAWIPAQGKPCQLLRSVNPRKWFMKKKLHSCSGLVSRKPLPAVFIQRLSTKTQTAIVSI